MRQASLYRLRQHWQPVNDDTLSHSRYSPPSAGDAQSFGWISSSDDPEQAWLKLDTHLWLCRLLITRKLLPAGTLNKAVREKISAIETSECRKLSRAEQQDIREEQRKTMLAQAFCEDSPITVILDSRRNLLLIDQTSKDKCNWIISWIRGISSTEAIPVRPRNNLIAWLTGLTAGNEPPPNLSTGGQFRLISDSSEDPAMRISKCHLPDDRIQAALQAGMNTTELELYWKARTRLRLTDSLQLRSLRFDIPIEEAGNPEDIHASRLLQARELIDICQCLLDALDGWQLNSGDTEALPNALQRWCQDIAPPLPPLVTVASLTFGISIEKTLEAGQHIDTWLS